MENVQKGKQTVGGNMFKVLIVENRFGEQGRVLFFDSSADSNFFVVMELVSRRVKTWCTRDCVVVSIDNYT